MVFWRALQKAHPQRRYRSVVILGAGGAALAVIEAAVRYGVQQMTVLNVLMRLMIQSFNDWLKLALLVVYRLLLNRTMTS